MSDIVVFSTPMSGTAHRKSYSRNVVILALCGDTRVGWQQDRTALVVDQAGNISWIEADGLVVTDSAILASVRDEGETP